MPKVSVYLPVALAQKVRENSDINWSRVYQDAVRNKLQQQLLQKELGRTEEQMASAHYRYQPWAEGWDTPEMAAYDTL